MKCALADGYVVNCWPLGDGRCGVEGNVVPCRFVESDDNKITIRVTSPTVPNNCSVTEEHEVCVPTISVQDPELMTIEDINRDGYICHDEAWLWLKARYDNYWGNAVFPTCERFDKSRAITTLKALRPQMSAQIGWVSHRLFSDCAYGTKASVYRAFQTGISQAEQRIIDYPIQAAADRGAGQLGMSWIASTGEIVGLRQDSDGAKSGLRNGDKIISVDGFDYTDTVDYKLQQWYSWVVFWPVPENNYESMKKAGVPANSLFFGPCGSTAKVEIERDRQRMTLEIKRGRG